MRRVLPLALVGLVLLAGGCGAGKSSKSGGTTIQVGLVTDIGGLNDRSFNHLKYVGLLRAQQALGVEGRVLQSKQSSVVDQAKCKEIALNQIGQGSQAVMQVAGGCGLGALDAAKEKQAWGIGADADQSFLGPFILTSALKKDDVAVFKVIKSVQDGTFAGGKDIVFDVASGAAGLGKISPKVPQDIVTKALQKQKDFAAGKVPNIPTEVK